MKKLFILLFILSGDCFAHGWMEYKVARFFEQGKIGPVVAIGLREPLVLGLHYLSWNGVGIDVRDKIWLTSNHDLEVNLTDKISTNFGVSLRDNDVNYSDVHVGLKIELWE